MIELIGKLTISFFLFLKFPSEFFINEFEVFLNVKNDIRKLFLEHGLDLLIHGWSEFIYHKLLDLILNLLIQLTS